MNSREAYIRTKRIFAEKGISNSASEAMILCEFILGCRKEDILLDTKVFGAAELNRLEALSKKRTAGYPLQYIIGSWDFYGLSFKVGEGVLIPRADTEVLVELVLKKLELKLNLNLKLNRPKFIDLCGGSGCIAISVKKNCPLADVYVLEKSEQALEYLKENAKINGVDLSIINADVTDSNVLKDLPLFDIIASNPPYLTESDMNNLQTEVTHEPSVALYGGGDGLDFYREITKLWKSKLAKNGILAYEIGLGHEKNIEKILLQNNLTKINLKQDLNNIPRIIYAE